MSIIQNYSYRNAPIGDILKLLLQDKIQKLDKEERVSINAIENDEIVSVGLKKTKLQELQEITKNTLVKTRAISIRSSERDLLKIKAAAVREWMPYQTFIFSTLHKKVQEQVV